jgi:hypothetical protein
VVSETSSDNQKVLISAKFERGRSLIRNFAIKTKDGNKRYQRKKERMVKVLHYTCTISFFFGYLNLFLKPLSYGLFPMLLLFPVPLTS